MEYGRLLTRWSFEPTVLLGIALAALLYWRGVRYSYRAGIGRHLTAWRSGCFGLGLLTVFVALESPLDVMSEKYVWAHMIQHELLVIVAAPLLLLGTPLWPFWRGVPLSARRATLRWALGQRWIRRTWRAVGRALFAPIPSLVIFMAVFSVWHVPTLYDLALERTGVHVLEHMTFLVSALMVWAQVIPSRPIQPGLSLIGRVLYLGAVGMYSNLMGSFFVFSTGPFYHYYAALSRPAGMMDALVDQHLAGAAMDVPSTIIFFVAMSACLLLWLREDERQGAEEQMLASGGAGVVSRPAGPAEPPESVAVHLYE